MIFIVLHKNESPRFINLNTVSMISDDGGIAKIFFDGDQYITADESLDDVAELLAAAGVRMPMINPKTSGGEKEE